MNTARNKNKRKSLERKKSKGTVENRNENRNEKINESIGEEDIVQLILKDHKPLRKLLKTLKDSDSNIEDRQAAFEEFAPLFLSHIRPEEQTLYVYLKHDQKAREKGLEGDVEHALAAHLLEEARRTADDALWSARVKVMSELIEHHLEEEEEDLLPKFKKLADSEDRRELGRDFLKLKNRLLEEGARDVSGEPLESYINH